MEHHERKSGNNGISVEVATKNFISGKKDSKKSVEDTNCNLTILSSKDEKVIEEGLIQSCEQELNELSLNGPTKLSNGIENVHLTDNCCSLDNSNSKDVSSQCETCVKASENSIDEVEPISSKVSQIENDHSNNQETIDVVNCNEDSKPQNADINCASAITGTFSPASEGLKRLNDDSDRNIECSKQNDIAYVSYESELQMPDIMRLIQKDLSEPYSIYTYRYFIHNWPQLCFLAMDGSICVGAIVCKLDMHRKVVKRGYIAMLAVDEKYRKRKIGSNLVLKAIRAMVADGADEVVLETEITNKPALRLYENLGFVRDKRLFRYYLNGVDALRLKLWLR
ncbi:N-alpha-acetyltransferase 30 [Halyomorpha halys]|uniref:N-alpha-acetyltransferase 30 n=1 Tax=Halyomorpha halys TaxID=286706 RepID=UPI0006D4EEBE|nr:N-alpha-acetyltransferase 30 [Halyomorpha halys]